jgi:predicted secreted acid phosphatase
MQAFSLAKIRIDDAIEENPGVPLAIITDIDSTIADDTCYVAGAVLNAAGRDGVEYFDTLLAPWVNDDWCGYYQAVATEADTAIPGAKQFVDYTYQKGVEWFYITNRPYYELDLTVKQLEHQKFFENYDPTKTGFGYEKNIVDAFANVENWQEYHYPGWYGTEEHNKQLDEELAAYAEKVNEESGNLEMQAGSFSVKGDYRVQVQGKAFDSDKSVRRYNVEQLVEEKGGKVVLYMGDSINDMVSDAEEDVWGDHAKDFTRKQFNETRTANASDPYWAGDWGKDQSVKEDYNPGHWGYDFIVLPNATYGDWYKATWAKKSSLTEPDHQQYIFDQIWGHSYLNSDKFETWYEGPSPANELVQ